MWIWIFCRSGLKVLFTPPKFQFSVGLPPKFRVTSFSPPKALFLRGTTRFEPSSVQIWRTVRQGFFEDQFRSAQGSNSISSAEHKPVTGAGGGAPSGGPGSRAPGGRSGGQAPESWMPFCFWLSKGSCKCAPLLTFAKVSKSHSEWMSHCFTTHLQRIYHIQCRAAYIKLSYTCVNRE